MLYANYAFVAALFVVAGFILGRGTYPSVSRWLTVRDAKRSFLAFKAAKIAEGLQTYTCKGCGKKQRSIGIPTGWISQPSMGTFNCSTVCVHRKIGG